MMKATFSTLFCMGLLFGTGIAFPATEAQYVSPPSGPPDELEQLVAPIALYPDPLVALILPASTESTDIVLATRYLDKGGTPDDIEVFPWADSVKGLAHYPELTRWMNENLSWTRQLGDAYATQPAEVMAAIQHARARALANGTLASTSQQQVIVSDGHILIVPAQPNVIYVPRYDPEIIYYAPTTGYPTRSWITFGTGFGVGWWLSYSCDWRLRSIWFDDLRRDHWREHRDWRHHYIPHRKTKHPPTGWRQWKPKSGRPHHHTPPSAGNHPHGKVARPAPLPHTPRYDRQHARPSSRSEREDRRPVHQTVTQPVSPQHATTTARPPSPPTVASPPSTTPPHHRRISSPTTTRKQPQPHVRKEHHPPERNVTRHSPTPSSRPTTHAAPAAPPAKRVSRPPSHTTIRHAKPVIRSEKKDVDKDKHTDR